MSWQVCYLILVIVVIASLCTVTAINIYKTEITLKKDMNEALSKYLDFLRKGE